MASHDAYAVKARAPLPGRISNSADCLEKRGPFLPLLRVIFDWQEEVAQDVVSDDDAYCLTYIARIAEMNAGPDPRFFHLGNGV